MYLVNVLFSNFSLEEIIFLSVLTVTKEMICARSRQGEYFLFLRHGTYYKNGGLENRSKYFFQKIH